MSCRKSENKGEKYVQTVKGKFEVSRSCTPAFPCNTCASIPLTSKLQLYVSDIVFELLTATFLSKIRDSFQNVAVKKLRAHLHTCNTFPGTFIYI